MSDKLSIGIDRLEPTTDEGQLALGRVHGTTSPVTCNCVRGGVPMYVARVEDRYIVKRMPALPLRPQSHLGGVI
jgi:hypothetical protein